MEEYYCINMEVFQNYCANTIQVKTVLIIHFLYSLCSHSYLDHRSLIDHEWIPWKLRYARHPWNPSNLGNMRNFMETIATEIDGKKVEDWWGISIQDLQNFNQKNSMIKKYGTISNLLSYSQKSMTIA
jgi:hypothetical protein